MGETGYIYFSDDITSAVEVQSAGVVTAQDLNAIHGYDPRNLVAVGNSNAVVLTRDGVNWSLITGPAVGVNLNAVWMHTADEWLVGTADGRLFYTRDGGSSWTAKAFPGSGAGAIHDIVFSTHSVGYMSHATAAPVGRILRSIDGGNSWYVLPEGTATFPDNDRVNALAVCEEDPNVVFGGGLAGTSSDGFLVKVA